MARKLLLADDSVTIQRVIELTFADEDIEVITVGDGQRAVERIESDRPDIVLADIGMPERDGYEVASYVKERPHLAHIPVILLTGAFERIDEPRARAAGCDGVLAKPFEPQAVISQVRDLLSHRRAAGKPTALSAPQPEPTAAASAPQTQPTVVSAVASHDAEPPAPETPVVPAWGGEPATAGGPDSLDEYFDRLDAAFANLGSPTPATGEHSDRELPGQSAKREHPGVDFDDDLDAFQAFERLDMAMESASTPPSAPIPFAPIERFASRADEESRGESVRSRPSIHEATDMDRTPTPIVRDSDQPPPIMREPEPTAPAMRSSEPSVRVVQPPPAPSAPAPAPLADAFMAMLAAEQGQPSPPAPLPAARTAQAAHAPAMVASAVPDDLVEQVARRVLERMSDRAVRETVNDVVLRVADRLVREEIERIKSDAR